MKVTVNVICKITTNNSINKFSVCVEPHNRRHMSHQLNYTFLCTFLITDDLLKSDLLKRVCSVNATNKHFWPQQQAKGYTLRAQHSAWDVKN